MADSKKKAVALKYDPLSGQAPAVTAKGRGKVAQKIIDLAQDHGIPVKEDPDLIEVLSTLELDQEIPPDIYVAVAELLAYVYNLKGKSMR